EGRCAASSSKKPSERSRWAADAGLMQIEWGERGVEVRGRGSAAVREGELPFDTILSDGVKEVSSGEGDTLRPEALQRNGSWGCGQVISCSHSSPVENGVGVVPL